MPRRHGVGQQSVKESAGLEQLLQGGEAETGRWGRLSGGRRTDPCRRCQVRPRRRDARTTAVGEDQQQMQALRALRPTKQLQRLPCERVMRTSDGDRGRKTLEVGSVSWCPSSTSTTTGYGECSV